VADIDTSTGKAEGYRCRPSIRVFVAVLVALLCTSGVLILLPSHRATAASTPSTTLPGGSAASRAKKVVTFGTQTATATKPDSRGIFSYAATPGGRVEDHIAVINYSEQTISLLIRGTDAENTPQGGFAALPVNETSHSVGTWIYLPKADLTVTLPPRSDEIIPFLVEVPSNATPGDHAGVVTATLASEIVSKSGQRARLLQTVGTRVFIRVSGPLHPGFTITGLALKYDGTIDPVGTGKAVITYTVDNTGNVALGGKQTVYVSGLFGSKKDATHVNEVQLLLPGNSVKETVRISGIYPEIRDTGHVSISPLYVQGTVQPASGPYEATVGFWAIPWILIAIIVVLIGLVVLWLRRRRRRRRGPGSGGGTPPEPDGAKVSEDSSEGSEVPASETPDEVSPEGAPVTKEPASAGTSEQGGA
jgi:hypothetical protein